MEVFTLTPTLSLKGEGIAELRYSKHGSIAGPVPAPSTHPFTLGGELRKPAAASAGSRRRRRHLTLAVFPAA